MMDCFHDRTRQQLDGNHYPRWGVKHWRVVKYAQKSRIGGKLARGMLMGMSRDRHSAGSAQKHISFCISLQPTGFQNFDFYLIHFIYCKVHDLFKYVCFKEVIIFTYLLVKTYIFSSGNHKIQLSI
jgi:hypothetical protein